MACAKIAFNCGDMVGKFRFVRLGVGTRTAAAALFIHPRNDSNSTLWLKPELLYELRRFHRDYDTGSIIYCTCSKIPGVQMSAHDYDLLRVLTAFKICYYIEALDIRESLRRQ